MTKDESTCPIPAKKAKSDETETDDRISEEEQSKLDEELLLAAKERFILEFSKLAWVFEILQSV